jgi:urate oxidase/2-oxo-4-hydroxy-4-carboxy-5-ureidoimidazoline decarboxylase
VERLASGPNDHYYGKADVTVYRLIRDGSARPECSPVFGANVKMLTWGGAFWPTYLRGDNTGLIATDSMKNFIHRQTFEFTDVGLEDYCRFIGRPCNCRTPVSREAWRLCPLAPTRRLRASR